MEVDIEFGAGDQVALFSRRWKDDVVVQQRSQRDGDVVGDSLAADLFRYIHIDQ